MSAIRQSLGGLARKLEKLEAAAQEQERAIRQKQQQDLFGAPAAPSRSAPPRTALLAKKLDGAIEKIEQILKEGAAHG